MERRNNSANEQIFLMRLPSAGSERLSTVSTLLLSKSHMRQALEDKWEPIQLIEPSQSHPLVTWRC